MATPFNVKKLIFSLITLLCVVIAVLYTFFSARSRGPVASKPSITARSSIVGSACEYILFGCWNPIPKRFSAADSSKDTVGLIERRHRIGDGTEGRLFVR